MTRLLITGALGHIGSKFIHSINVRDYEKVYILDNLSTQRYASLFHLPKVIQFIEDDIMTADLNQYLQKGDSVIHLAAMTDATSSFDQKDLVQKVNLEGTQRIAQACLRNQCSLIFPSTTSVYGVQNTMVTEECPLSDLKPQSPYAQFKLEAEHYLKKLSQEGLKCIICRLGTIFGTSIGMRFHTAVNKFCWQASMKQPLTVWETALHQKRPYLDLQDAIRAFQFIIQKELFNGEIYNVVTTHVTVHDIIQMIETKIPVTLNFVKTKIMNQLSYEVSSDKFKNLGFNFHGDLKKGIDETLELLRS